jgi:hypothetical protein
MSNHKETQQPPFHQPEPLTTPQDSGDKIADSFLRVIMLIISLVSLGMAMISAAYIAAQLLVWHNASVRAHIWAIIIAVGLAYAVGWIVALVGIRLFHNLVLPFFIQAYAIATIVGISILYIAILYRLYEQAYDVTSFFKYSIVMGVALAGLVGFHLLIEGHNLRPFAIPLLLIALVHLYLIVYHYVFPTEVDYNYLFWDILFFLGMATVSVLMLIHAGVLSGARNFIDGIFAQNHNGNREIPGGESR